MKSNIFKITAMTVFMFLCFFGKAQSITIDKLVSLEKSKDSTFICIDQQRTNIYSLEKLSKFKTKNNTVLILENNSNDWIEIDNNKKDGLVLILHSNQTIQYKYEILGFFPKLYLMSKKIINASETLEEAKKRIKN